MKAIVPAVNELIDNIVLIGMPGSGKSTIGILLAKSLGKEFLDTDILLQNSEKKLLYQIIEEEGMDAFIKKEAGIINSLKCSNTVISTGGSIVLQDSSMKYLKEIGTVLYLKTGLEILAERIQNMETRGIVKEKGQTLADIFRIRTPLYEKYADIEFECGCENQEKCVNHIIRDIFGVSIVKDKFRNSCFDGQKTE